VLQLTANLTQEGIQWQEHRYLAGDIMPEHTHSNWQFIVVLSGKIAFTDGTVLATGQSVRIPAGQSHGYTATEPTHSWSLWGVNPNA
jgi:quercetin dioxygenase-like cupin family protein